MKGHFYSTLNEFGYSIFQYVLGSVVLAIGMGLLVMLVSLAIFSVFKRSKIEA